MALTDRRDDMTLPELLDELEASRPELVAGFEVRHAEAWDAVCETGIGSPDDTEDDELAEQLEDLRDDLRSLLRV